MAHVLAKYLRESVLQATFKGRLTNRVITDSAVNIKSSFTEEPPFDIPESWKWFNLGDLVWNRKQKTPDKLFSYIDIGSIDNINQKLNDSENLIEPNKAPSRARKVVEYGDIIYSTVRPYLHNMAIIDRKFSHEPIASTGFAAMVCNDGVLNKYLFLYLKSPEFDKYANDTSNAKGVAYPAINDKKLYAAAIPLPPIEEQARIVARVDELMAKIDEYEKLENELIELKKNFPGDMKAAVLQAAMQGRLTEQLKSDSDVISKYKKNIVNDDNIIIPNNWAVLKLKDVATHQNGKAFKPTDWSQKGMKIIRIQNLTDPDAPANYCDPSIVEEKFIISNNDVLVSWSCTIDAYRYLGETAALNQHIFKVIFDKADVDLQFYIYAIKSLLAIIDSQRHGSTMTHITKTDYENLSFPLPPIEEQRRIVEKLDKILPLCEELEKEIA